MKTVLGFIITACILMNSGIVAFAVVAPNTCAKPIYAENNSQLSKLLSSVCLPLTAMNDQMRNDNPLVPNMRACAKSGTDNVDGNQAKKIIIPVNSRSLNMDNNGGVSQASGLARLYSTSFERPRIFPPPGYEICVNYAYLQYFVFLAKANLPWEIVLDQKG